MFGRRRRFGRRRFGGRHRGRRRHHVRMIRRHRRALKRLRVGFRF